MDTEKSVTRRDIGGQNFEISIREVTHPLGIPIFILALLFATQCVLHFFFLGPWGASDETLFTDAIAAAGIISIGTALALGRLHLWSHCNKYDKFCKWFYDESRRWSCAGLATALILGISTFLINNSLLLTSLTSINQPSSNFFFTMYYPTAMWTAGHFLFNLLIFLFYFKIDRSEDITKKITSVDGLLIFLFSLTPMATATAIHFQPWTAWILFLGSIITTLSAFFLWVRISRLHIPLDAEGESAKEVATQTSS